MRLVVALGGNALLRRGQSADLDNQRRNLADAATVLAALARDHTLVVTHGNGPQVGLLALQAEAFEAVRPYPLDVLGAETEGMLGYLIEQQLRNLLPGREIATVLTQVEVDAEDPAFAHPDKPIGPLYDRATAARLAAERGWSVARDGDAWRRVVASPQPRRILELNPIRRLVEHATLVICTGGGGIPVVADAEAGLRGVEAVIDKDLAAAQLAEDLEFDGLLMLTDVDAVYADWPEPRQAPIRIADPSSLRGYAFAAGSMQPKVEAACRFVERCGGLAGIGRPSDAAAILTGDAGTLVRR